MVTRMTTQAWRRHYKGLTLATLAVAALTVSLITGGSTRIDGPLLDILVGVRSLVFPVVPDSKTFAVVVAAVDERSLQEPELAAYPRTLLAPVWAKLLTTVMEAGAKAVGFDFVWTYSANLLFPDYDRPVITVLDRYRGRIVLARSKQQLPATPFLAAMRFDPGAVGLADLPVDSDGVYRRLPLGDLSSEDQLQTGFATAILRRAHVMELPKELVLAPTYHVEWIPTYALVDVLRCGNVAPDLMKEVFKDKIVLIGSTLAEEDRKATTSRYLRAPNPEPISMHPCGLHQLAASVPGGSTVPGVFVHAAAIEAVMSGHVTGIAPPALVAALTGISAIGAGSAGLMLTPLWAAVSTGTATVLLLVIAVGSLAKDWWIPIAFPLFTLLLAPLVAYVVRSSVEEAARRRFQDEIYFLTGLAPSMLEQVARGEQVLRIEGQPAEVTVMFADLSGFTELSTEVEPEILVTQCRQSLAYIVIEIEATGGWVNQFLGDCVMAIWGAPLQDEDHAMHAVQAALAASRRIAVARHAAGTNNPRVLDVKIGVNSGPASIGKFGSGGRGTYTAAGSTVNVAARLAQIPPQYGCRIVLGAETAERVKGRILLRELDRVRLKGVPSPLSIFEPLDQLHASSPQHDPVNLYSEALKLYRKGQFEEAAAIWQAILKCETDQSDNPAQIMYQRARSLAKHRVSGEWDGVWDLTRMPGN